MTNGVQMFVISKLIYLSARTLHLGHHILKSVLLLFHTIY